MINIATMLTLFLVDLPIGYAVHWLVHKHLTAAKIVFAFCALSTLGMVIDASLSPTGSPYAATYFTLQGWLNMFSCFIGVFLGARIYNRRGDC